MDFSPRDLVVLFSGFLGLLLAAYLIWHPGKTALASKLLAAFLCLQGCSLVVSVFLFRHFLFQDMDTAVRILFYLESTLLMVEGALLYAYCAVLLLGNRLTLKAMAQHLVLIAVFAGVSMVVYAQMSIVDYFDPTAEQRPAQLGFAYSAIHAVRFGYGVLCLVLVNRYKARMAERFSNVAPTDTRWLFTLIKGFVFYRAGWLLFNLYFAFAALNSWNMLDYRWLVGGGILLLDLGWLGVHIGLLFFGLRYSGEFCSLAPAESLPKRPINQALVDRLETLMRTHHPYTNPELKLDELAAQLSLPPKTLSATINQHYKNNFCEFINAHRVVAAKARLADPAQTHKTVLDISCDVGFNSKSAFNRAFKKETLMTPLAYRKQALQSI